MHETPELGVLLLANYRHEESMACELESRLGRCYTLPPPSICINTVIQKYPSAPWELWQYVCPPEQGSGPCASGTVPYVDVEMSH